jgi:hypothetical protein
MGIKLDLLNELFQYKDGLLISKVCRAKNKIKIGDLIGCLMKNGYLKTRIGHKEYLVHRIIFMMHNGYLPEQVDHIDGNPLNNRIENLRAATNQQNSFNSKLSKANTSGVKGVSWINSRKKWEAKVMTSGNTVHLGRFDDIQDAENAVRLYRIEQHGKFARHA